MNTTIKGVSLAMIGALSLSAHAADESLFSYLNCMDFFVGADAQKRHMGFKQDFGDNIFAKHYGQYSVYAGTRFLKYFGFALGYESTSNKQRDDVINEGEIYLGVRIDEGDGIESHTAHSKIKAAFVDLMGFYPICPRYHVDAFGSVGFARSKLTLDDVITANDGIPVIDPNTNIRTYDEKKTIMRATIGVQTIIMEHFGFRLMGGWENTNRFKGLKPMQVPDAVTDVKAKNSFLYGIGVFLTT